MRAFKIWNKNRTSSFDLSGLNVITTDIAGLGNKFTNELYDGRIKKHLINQHNSFDQISLTVNFGVNSNAYQKYRDFMNFIRENGRNILVIEYYTTGTSRFVDVVLSNVSKSQKTGFGVLVETVTFERLTPYYIQYRRTGTSILVSNNYMENVMPKITMSGRTYPAGTKIRVGSKNNAMPDLSTATDLGGGVYRVYDNNDVTVDYNLYNGVFTINGIATSQSIFMSLKPDYDNYNISYIYISGSVNTYNGFIIDVVGVQTLITNRVSTYSIDKDFTFIYNTSSIAFYVQNGSSFNNYQFKLQLEKAGNNLELDRPIDELNGYPLREVFEGGNLATQESLMYIPNNGYMIENSYYEKDTNAQHYVEINITTGISNNDNLYIIYNYENLSNRWIYFYVYNVGGIYEDALLGTSNDFNKLLGCKYKLPSDIGTTKDLRIRYSPRISQTSSEVYLGELDYKVYDVYLPKIYNLTTLGISNLTVEQMDYWFNIYQSLLTTPTEYSIPVTDTREIELNETILSNQELIIDSENKSITLNGVNAYQITNKDKSTFLNLPEGDYLVECDTPITVEYKRWVID